MSSRNKGIIISIDKSRYKVCPEKNFILLGAVFPL
jgi:hypothetical protein